jgi:hypothetical protein
VSDEEHISIVDSYFDGMSMGKTARKLDRSVGTIHAQIHAHDESIQKTGYCLECRRLKGSHETEKTEKRIIDSK